MHNVRTTPGPRKIPSGLRCVEILFCLQQVQMQILDDCSENRCSLHIFALPCPGSSCDSCAEGGRCTPLQFLPSDRRTWSLSILEGVRKTEQENDTTLQNHYSWVSRTLIDPSLQRRRYSYRQSCVNTVIYRFCLKVTSSWINFSPTSIFIRQWQLADGTCWLGRAPVIALPETRWRQTLNARKRLWGKSSPHS